MRAVLVSSTLWLPFRGSSDAPEEPWLSVGGSAEPNDPRFRFATSFLEVRNQGERLIDLSPNGAVGKHQPLRAEVALLESREKLRAFRRRLEGLLAIAAQLGCERNSGGHGQQRDYRCQPAPSKAHALLRGAPRVGLRGSEQAAARSGLFSCGRICFGLGDLSDQLVNHSRSLLLAPGPRRVAVLRGEASISRSLREHPARRRSPDRWARPRPEGAGHPGHLARARRSPLRGHFASSLRQLAPPRLRSRHLKSP